MAFCSKCGNELNQNAKFCSNCGTEIKEKNEDKRKIVFDGKIHKCPSCGEILDSFEVNCPYCDYEIRNIKSCNSIQEFIEKLEQIESRQMQDSDEKKSVMEMFLGKDLKNKDEMEKAKNEFNKQKEREKINVIKNFYVPNTKEDIIEFMLLVTSNIDVKNGIDDAVSKAWISKLEQIYQRAKLSIKKTSDFTVIEKIYNRKKLELKNRKYKGLAIASFIVGGYSLLMGVIFFPAEIPIAGVILTLLGITIIVIGIKFISIYNRNNKNLI